MDQRFECDLGTQFGVQKDAPEDAQVSGGLQQGVGQGGTSLGQVLAVIKAEEKFALAQVLYQSGDQEAVWLFLHPNGGGHYLRD
jgi:hypothetical protein